MIKEDIENTNVSIENIVKAALDEIDLLKRVIPLIIDCLWLKGDIYSIYGSLKLFCKILRKDDLFQSFKRLSFSDFIILLLKMIERKDVLG